MSRKQPRSNRQRDPQDAPDSRNPSAAALALTDAARAWTALVDGWWRQQSAALPPELERAMSATLDQSKALVDMAFAPAARAVSDSPPGANTTRASPPGDPPGAGELSLWRPVIDACLACESSLVGNTGGGDSTQSNEGREYQRAAGAYLNEFVKINSEVAQRLEKKLAASPPTDFRQLHGLVVEEAERAYLDRVSTDKFATLQAALINAMLRLRREMAGTGAVRKA
jgi:hypothetical protein